MQETDSPKHRRWRLINPLTLALTALAAVMLVAVLWHESGRRERPLESLASMQGADAPLLLPADGEPRHRLHQLSAWELARVPSAPRFDSPLGAASGALTYNPRPLWTLDEERGGHHTGDDLDGIGGMNTDLGDPVRAAADGLVLHAGTPSPEWGGTVLVGHRLADGRLLQTMYAHLRSIDVAVGSQVARGRRLGTVGTAGGRYPAHLHFEVRESDGAEIGGGYGMRRLNRLDPAATLEELRGAPPRRPAPSLLPRAMATYLSWNDLTIEGADKLGEILEP